MEHFFFALVLWSYGRSASYMYIPMQSYQLCETSRKQIMSVQYPPDVALCVQIKEKQ